MESFAKDVEETVKALIVDSDIGAVHALGAALRKGGYDTLEATTFEEAKRLWVSERPPILIADVRLGQFNGLQLLLRARADRPDVTAVITSAVPDKVLEADTRRFGGTFVVKPIAGEQVIDLVRAIRPSEDSPMERRVGQRRRSATTSGFLPERRVSDRRRPPGR